MKILNSINAQTKKTNKKTSLWFSDLSGHSARKETRCT